MDDMRQQPLIESIISRRELLKYAASLGLGLASSSVLAACGSGSSSGGAPAGGAANAPAAATSAPSAAGAAASGASKGGPATVTVWTWREQDTVVWQKAEQALQKTIPGLKIDVQPSKATEYDAKVSTAMQGGQGPDIITTRAGEGFFQKYVDANMFVPLADKLPNASDIPEGTRSQVSYKGQMYAVPFASQISFFYYNIDIFNKYGLKPPTTWNDLIQICETLKKNSVTPIFTPSREGWALSLYADCIGATFLGDDYAGQLIRGEKTFTDAKFVELIKRLQSLQPYFQKDYVGNNTADERQAFEAGQAAMMLDGIWTTQSLIKDVPDLKFDYFLCPPDQAGGKVQSYVFVDGGYAVNAASKVRDTAVEVVKYAATKDYGQAFTDATGEMSSIPGVEAKADKPHLQKGLEFAHTTALKNLFRIRSVFDAGNPGMSTLLNPLLEGLWANKVTPEDLCKQVQEGLAQWYPAFKGKS